MGRISALPRRVQSTRDLQSVSSTLSMIPSNPRLSVSHVRISFATDFSGSLPSPCRQRRAASWCSRLGIDLDLESFHVRKCISYLGNLGELRGRKIACHPVCVSGLHKTPILANNRHGNRTRKLNHALNIYIIMVHAST